MTTDSAMDCPSCGYISSTINKEIDRLTAEVERVWFNIFVKWSLTDAGRVAIRTHGQQGNER